MKSFGMPDDSTFYTDKLPTAGLPMAPPPIMAFPAFMQDEPAFSARITNLVSLPRLYSSPDMFMKFAGEVRSVPNAEQLVIPGGGMF